ncbi:hypothetical protein F4777DRAFT_560380 [Nemania sp. FL0916]|nr:hypothetical protein F4777DRAFT_560380 [Nemania sp. FL0916]
MDAASLALGALPIAIRAIENYQQGLRIIDNYNNYTQTLAGIRRNLKWQQNQLQATLEGIGLSNPKFDEVQERLRQIKPDCYEDFIDVLQHMGRMMESLLDKLDIDFDGKPRWNDTPDRISWEWRRVKRSFGHKTRKELFDELQKWNNALRYCLRDTSSASADPMGVARIRGLNPKFFDQARKNVRIVHEALAKSWTKECNALLHPSNMELNWQDIATNSVGQLQLSLPESGEHNECRHWQRVLITIGKNRANSTSNSDAAPVPSATTLLPQESGSKTPKRLKLLPDNIGRRVSFALGLAVEEPSSALPKSRGLSPAQGPHQTDLNESPKNPLISQLCSFTKQKMWSGHLVHTNAEEERDICLQKLSTPCSTFSNCSLDSMIADRHFSSRKSKHTVHARLSRRQRLRVAAAVTWAVLILCDTPWLERRRLGREDIALLISAVTQENEFGHPEIYPTLMHTFSSQTGPTNDLMDSQNIDNYYENQLQHKIIFELGVMLIELGLNKRLDQINMPVNMDSSTSEASILNDYAIARHVFETGDLELEVGEKYAAAAERCVRFHFQGHPSTLSLSHSGFRKQFYDGVVVPVQEVFDLQVDSVDLL